MKYIKSNVEDLKLLHLIDSSPEDITGILARYSRSNTSLEDLVLKFSKENNGELVKRIINNYGHSSIMNMGYMTCCMEGVSLLALLDIFNRCPLQGGQERSTRYIDLDKQINLKDNKEKLNHIYIDNKAEEIYSHWIDSYNLLKGETFNSFKELFNISNNKLELKSCELRTLDCIRYFIPMGTLTQGGIIQSGKEWSKLIKYLKSHKEQEFNLIGEELERILSKEKESEGKNLIKHTEPSNDIYIELKEIIERYKDLYTIDPLIEDWEIELLNRDLVDIERVISIYYPDIKRLELESSNNNLIEEIGNWIIKNGNHHNELNNEFRSIGNYIFKGKSDLGTLTDINRHRGCLFIPFLSSELSEINIDKIYPTYEHLYSLPQYLEIEELSSLREKYIEAFRKGFELLEEYTKRENIDINKIKYLLPKAYRTNYYISLDINRLLYLISLRGKVGGHISYRIFSYYLSKSAIKNINLFKHLDNIIEYPDIYSKEEFLSRG